MILNSPQTVTGNKTFNSGTLILAGSSSGTTILNATAGAGGTVTLPALTGTVALLENSQTFTGAKTFSAQATFTSSPASATSVSIAPTTGSLTNAQLTISGGTINWIGFGVANNAAAPVFGTAATRSAGTKIVLGSNIGASSLDYALGIGSAQLWISSGGSINFYPNSTTAALAVSSTALTLATGVNIVLATSGAGTRIGTSTSQLLSFWNKTPIVQPTTAITGAAFVQVNTTTAVSQASTFGGYTLQQIAAALINTGILA